MRYSILGFNQEEVLKLKHCEVDETTGKEKLVRVDVIDLLILKDIADFMNRRNVIKYIINEKQYFSVKYNTIICDLPILGLKQQALSDRLNKLCTFGLLEKEIVKNQSGSYTTFRIGETYEKIVYNDDVYSMSVLNHPHMYLDTSAKVAEYKCYNINNIYNNNSSANNSSNKEEKENILKEKKKRQTITYTEDFEKAFILTGRKGSKKNAFKRWQSMSEEDKARAFIHIPFYYKSNNRAYLKDFEGYLNGRYFDGVVYDKNGNILYDPDRTSGDAPYTPFGNNMLFWSEYENNYLYIAPWREGGRIADGYTDDNRPNGARIMLNNARGSIIWDANAKQWVRENKKQQDIPF